MHHLIRGFLRQSLKDPAAIDKRAADALNNAALAANVKSSPGAAKRALCVGINSYTAPYELDGCVNDARNWATACRGLGFDVRELYDQAATRAAILASLGDLIGGARAGDVIVFQFSGHGTQVDNLNDDEYDSLDEAFCPVDFTTGSVITDDDIRELFSKLLPGVNLTCFFDCCYSGTITRALASAERAASAATARRARYVPYSREISDRHRAFQTAQRTPVSKGRGPEVDVPAREIVFSACQPHEVAFEAEGSGQFSARAVSVLLSGGAMTNGGFIERVTAAFGNNATQHPILEGPKDAVYRAFLAPVAAPPGRS
jgi:hypothetical protein